MEIERLLGGEPLLEIVAFQDRATLIWAAILINSRRFSWSIHSLLKRISVRAGSSTLNALVFVGLGVKLI